MHHTQGKLYLIEVKTMKNYYLLLCIFLLSILFGCKKDVLDVNPEFEGKWETKTMGNECDSYTIVINSDNSGEYIHSSAIEDIHYSGKVKLKDNTLKIGSHKFTVNASPASSVDTLEVCSFCDCVSFYPYSAYLTIDDITYYKFN